MRAKFRCSSVSEIFWDEWKNNKSTGTKVKGSEQVTFHAVYATDGPNKEWATATPSGSLSMNIDNPAAWGHFKVDEEYFLDFFHAPKEVLAPPAPTA
jgi:hypothetical protein